MHTDVPRDEGQLASRRSHTQVTAGWWTVAVLFVAALISYSDRLVLSVLVDPLREDLRLSDSAVSLLQGPAFTLVYVVAALGFGRLADRTQRIRLLLFGVSLWCA